MPLDEIIIKGAKNNNLKNVNLTIPRNKLIVFTGVSGSGKSSLAFDTIYAEGQRRYVESLSSYARQFLGQTGKPNVEYIEGLSPAVSISQKTTSHNPRSTVGTITEIYDYLRLLYARIGVAHCYVCGQEIKRQTLDQMVDRTLNLECGTKIQILAPLVVGKKGEHKKTIECILKKGYSRVRIDGKFMDLNEEIKLEKAKKHTIEVIIDRLILKKEARSRIAEALEQVFKFGVNMAIINVLDGEDILFSKDYACPEHNVCVEELSPRMFSFNSPFGACIRCTGLGVMLKVNKDLIIPDKKVSINDGGIKASGWYFDGGMGKMYMEGLSKHFGFSLDTPIKYLHKDILNVILYGSNEKIKFERNYGNKKTMFESSFEGIINNLERRFKETDSNFIKEELRVYMTEVICRECEGDRLKKEGLAVTVGKKNISNFCKTSIEKSLNFLQKLKLNERDAFIADRVLKEIINRLEFLKNVGLAYLTLARSAATLSGGENQRLRLATQIGSSLIGVLYVLDEPSIGLHQRDNEKLIRTLKDLKNAGNTVIVVEHDEDIIYTADYIVDIGPGAGVHGGKVVCSGTVEDIKNCKESLTGMYISGVKKITMPQMRRNGNGKFITIIGASENNLKNIEIKIPLGILTVVTGVSGSGKSTLINDILYKALAVHLNASKLKPGKYKKIQGLENLDKIINVDQSPIGKTPRSNPVTYTGVFTDIRELFANLPDSKAKGYEMSRFSFNVKEGGRCEFCKGDGIMKIEMHFLPNVFVPCEICMGKKYNRETLEVKYKGKNIFDVLDMTIEESVTFFGNIPKIKRKLQSLFDVGLGYMKLGQSAMTLSGGEAQRIKLATELAKPAAGQNMYILDEPTTGLHISDVDKLIYVLQRLVDMGNSMVIIEHNLDVIKNADYIIDLGPEGGDAGGTVLCCGTPEEITKCTLSYTGNYLKRHIK